MKSFVLAVLGFALIAVCVSQMPGMGLPNPMPSQTENPNQALEKDMYGDQEGCCKAFKMPAGNFCPRNGTMCNCCTTYKNRNCWPADTTNCEYQSSCQLPGANATTSQ